MFAGCCSCRSRKQMPWGAPPGAAPLAMCPAPTAGCPSWCTPTSSWARYEYLQLHLLVHPYHFLWRVHPDKFMGQVRICPPENLGAPSPLPLASGRYR